CAVSAQTADDPPRPYTTAFVATEVWRTSNVARPMAARPSATARAGSSSVDNTFTMRPSSVTRSVNVPPVSAPHRMGRAARLSVVPQDVGPSAWAIPDPETADEAGLVGFGADLEPATLVDAYRRGLFPWPHEGVPLPWFSPDPRGLLRPDGVRVSRSLRQRLRGSGWSTTVDAAFDEVIARCAVR